MNPPCVILSACRTPIGALNGRLSPLPATMLGAVVVGEAIRRAGIEPEAINQVIMGNVLSAGLGQAPARQAALGAELPPSVSTLTVNKVCGSGLKAVMLGAQSISVGEAEVVVAGGMESMSRAPYMLDRARTGYRLGHSYILDSMICDGLWDVYKNYHMGAAAEIIAERYKFTREDLDNFAIRSYEKTLQAQREGRFDREIVSVEVPEGDRKQVVVKEDECPRRFNREGMAKLPPAFKDNGVLTPGNSSAISDGASALVVTSEDKAKSLGIKPMVRIVAQSEAGLIPELFSLAPVTAIKGLLKKTGLTIKDIDLFEINEAFASTGLAISQELEIDPGRLNVKGGAIALGHPIGASGARILTTLLYAMEERRAKMGLASLCIGGGEAVAMMVEAV
ncbi:MAG TPA: thiolase family protein [Candidatus Avalokitesvara rifleensis]|uniref:thiolase family protein n=1 Tax=Candidatus Avalokitesvara rifleensis TaxID=3367620 RepID=UPI002713C0BE|nr:thiolase family protein [Candidatus Brocadiales bacterium]